MNLEYLRSFFVIIEEGSITRAARKLHISQPALSAQIAALEKYFQTPLLERSTRGVQLTCTGEVLYQEGKRLVNLFDNISTKIEKHKVRPCAELHIGAATTVGNYLLPRLVYQFKQTHPQCAINLDIGNSAEVVEKLIQGKVRMGIVEGPITEELRKEFETNQVYTRRLGSDQLMVVVPAREPWLGKSVVSVAELMEADLIIREPGSGIRKTIEYALERHDLKLSDFGVYLEFKSVPAILSTVSSGYGTSLLPNMALKNDLEREDIAVLPLEGIQFSHTLTMIYQHGQITDQDCSSDFYQLLLARTKEF